MGLNKPITHINPLDPSTALRMTPLFDQTKTQVIQLPPSDEGGGARQRDGGRATKGGFVGLEYVLQLYDRTNRFDRVVWSYY